MLSQNLNVPKVKAHTGNRGISLCTDDIKKIITNLSVRGHLSRILSASCLQQDQVSGPHTSVYLRKAHILLRFSLQASVRHSPHEE